MERKRNSGKRYFIWSIAKQMRVFEGRLSAERGSSLSGKQKRRTQNGEYKITHTGSTQEADRWHNVCCESAFQ